MVDFKELKVWQKAHQMTLTTYRVTSAFPQRRDVRSNQPTSSRNFFRRSEHCGRLWTPFRR